MSRILPVVALLVVLFPIAPVSAQSNRVNIRKIVFTGDPAPGGGVFDRFGFQVRTNTQGEVAFTARVENNGEEREGLYLWDGAVVHKLIAEGDTLLDDLVTFAGVDDPNYLALGDNGEVATNVWIDGPTGTRVVLLAASVDGIRTIVATGDPALQEGEVFSSGDRPRINNHGTVLFRATIRRQDASTYQAVYLATPTCELTEIAHQGSCNGDPELGDVIAEFPYTGPGGNLNDRGSVSVLVELCNGDRVVYLWKSDTGLQQLFRSGDPSPVNGMPMVISDLLFASIPGPWNVPTLLDDSDRILISMSPPVGNYLVTEAGVVPVWVRGDAADFPLENAVVWFGLSINNRKSVLLTLSEHPHTPEHIGFFIARDRQASSILIHNQAVPDITGEVFAVSANHLQFCNINDAGQTAFLSQIGPLTAYTDGLFLTDCHGTIHTIGTMVAPITVDEEEFEFLFNTFGLFASVPLNDAGPSEGMNALNDRGEIAFSAALRNDEYPDGVGAILIANIDGCPCTGDTNLDHTVNVFDLLNVLSQWGPCDGFCEGDVNFDHIVNVTDLLAVLAGWGPCDSE